MELESHPAGHREPLKGRLTFNKAQPGGSGQETGGQEVREEAAAGIQAMGGRDAEEKEERNPESDPGWEQRAQAPLRNSSSPAFSSRLSPLHT